MLRKLVLVCALAAVAAQAPGAVPKPMFPTLSPALTNPPNSFAARRRVQQFWLA